MVRHFRGEQLSRRWEAPPLLVQSRKAGRRAHTPCSAHSARRRYAVGTVVERPGNQGRFFPLEEVQPTPRLTYSELWKHGHPNVNEPRAL